MHACTRAHHVFAHVRVHSKPKEQCTPSPMCSRTPACPPVPTHMQATARWPAACLARARQEGAAAPMRTRMRKGEGCCRRLLSPHLLPYLLLA